MAGSHLPNDIYPDRRRVSVIGAVDRQALTDVLAVIGSMSHEEAVTC